VVTIDGTSITATTDANGRFSIAAPAGVTLVVSSADHEISLVQVTGDQLPDIELLRIGERSTEVIEVVGDAPIEAPGATTVGRGELRTIPGGGNDLLASVDILPGVTSGPSGGPTSFNGVVIRGSAPEDSKILVDGFKVPILYHTVGFRSILPFESIETLEYLPGGFDVSYGRATSGVISVTTRRGDDQLGGYGELSMIDGGVLAQGSAGKDSSFLVALRRSTIDLILPTLIPDDTDINLATVPRYWDLQARYDTSLGENTQLAFSLLGADDSLELYIDDERDLDERFFNRTRFVRALADLRWRRGPWALSLAAAPMLTEITFKTGRMQDFTSIQLENGLRSELVHSVARRWGLENVVTRVGVEADIGRADLNLVVSQVPDEGQPRDPNIDYDDIRLRFKGVIWVPDVATWVATAANFGAARLTAGLRVDAFGRVREVSVQPRLELAVSLPATLKIRLAAGFYSRPPEFQAEYLDKELDPELTKQAVLGAELNPLQGLKLQASTYYTDRTRMLTGGLNGKYSNTGRGTTFGGELLAIYRRSDVSAWLSYSLARSTRVDSPGAPSRLFDYDQPHDVNLSLSWTLGRWQLGGRFRYSSGQPYTPVLSSVYDSDADRYVPLFGEINSERLAAHHQLDLRVDRSWKTGRVTLTAFLDVQNVYLNAAVAGYGYSFDYSERFLFESLPILPMLGLRGEL
jgi:TonB-dependent Receptor Plug Domain